MAAFFPAQLTRLYPPGDNGKIPCVIVLSDWAELPRHDVINCVAEIFRQAGERQNVATVLIVDDLGSIHAEYEVLLSALTEAGGIILAPDSPEEIEMVRRDPLVFAEAQLIAAQSHSAVATAPLLSPSMPGSPDAYKEFGKAVTRLLPGELEEVIEGRRHDDWRYLN
jgi:hypothetical protein